MFNLILKNKCIVAVLLVMVISAFVFPMQSCKTNKVTDNAAATEKNMLFERINFAAAVFLQEKREFFEKGQFTEHKNKHQRPGLGSHILSVPDSTYRNPFADYRVKVLPFYVIICALLIHTIIKYIFSKDGKKRLIDYIYLCNF